ncbi:hypothetical protein [Neisseria animaloris]|uniref:hypothetical protein n=1 Tax=Neisseria animaloris TaxID=326522 RepID=UPI000D2F90F9|nr:hypothetical protein [Neisseria animaloris]
MSRIELRNKIDRLCGGGSWESFGLYIKTGQLSGFLDINGDVVEGQGNTVKQLLEDFEQLNPKTPSEWCKFLNEKYNARLDCSMYEKLDRSSILEKIKRLFDL